MSKLKSLLLDEIASLNAQIEPLQERVDAAWVLVQAMVAFGEEAEKALSDKPVERVKRKRRTNAEIAADKLAAMRAGRDAVDSAPAIAVITDEDEAAADKVSE
jgi:hypothetical protein